MDLTGLKLRSLHEDFGDNVFPCFFQFVRLESWLIYSLAYGSLPSSKTALLLSSYLLLQLTLLHLISLIRTLYYDLVKVTLVN